MSLQDVADLFADALNTVPELTGFDAAPDGPSVGDAWARWTGLEAQGAPGLYLTNWQIIVVTGGTPTDGHAFLDQILDSVLEALQPIAFVQSANPTVIQTGNGGDLYGLVVQAVRE